MHIVVVGMGYGDEGKGATVDFLASRPGRYHAVREHKVGSTDEVKFSQVVRYSGGHQAAHNVVLADGRHHTFAQFGSASFRGLTTRLACDFIVEFGAMLAEAEALKGKRAGQIFVNEKLPVTTAYERALNRFQVDQSSVGVKNSTGTGIGLTRNTWLQGVGLRVVDVSDTSESILNRLMVLREYLESTYSQFGGSDYRKRLAKEFDAINIYQEARRIWEAAVELQSEHSMCVTLDDVPNAYHTIWEGSQGVQIDAMYGNCYNTWSRTTDRNARQVLDALSADYSVLGVLRAYATRHGDGTMAVDGVTDEQLIRFRAAEVHNVTSPWCGQMRYGLWRVEEIAQDCYDQQIHGLAINHLDVLDSQDFLLRLSEALQAYATENACRRIPIVLLGRGPTAEDRQWVASLPTKFGKYFSM